VRYNSFFHYRIQENHRKAWRTISKRFVDAERQGVKVNEGQKILNVVPYVENKVEERGIYKHMHKGLKEIYNVVEDRGVETERD
jgi:hypothetical protein